MCNRSWRNRRLWGRHLCFSIGPKITKLLKEIEYLFLVKLNQIPFVRLNKSFVRLSISFVRLKKNLHVALLPCRQTLTCKGRTHLYKPLWTFFNYYNHFFAPITLDEYRAWFNFNLYCTVKSTMRRMSTPVLISFSTSVHTTLSCFWTVLLFLTWLYTRFWLHMMQKHPLCGKHSQSLQTRLVIRFATIYDRLSLTYESIMTILLSTINKIELDASSLSTLVQNSIFRRESDIVSISTAFSPMSLKYFIKIYEQCLNNDITSTNITLKSEYDIAWWYRCQI